MTLVLLLSAVCFLAYANGGTIVSILWSWLLTPPCAALRTALIYSVTSGF